MAGLGKDADCCRVGRTWDGAPKGKETNIAGLNTYVSEPAQPSGKAVLMIADIHGWDFKNTRLIADAFAAEGYLAVLPDLFHGDKFPENPSPEKWGAWLERNPISATSRTVGEVEALLRELRAGHGVTAVGAKGYCWGGFYVTHFAATDQIQSGIVAHGSRIEPPMIDAITRPTFFIIPAEDQHMPTEMRGHIRKMLGAKEFETQVKEYPGVGHGFTVRPQDEQAVLDQSAVALQDSIAWFGNTLKA